MTDTVVLVHGIWMTGLELALLKRRLRRQSFRTTLFHYRSLCKPVEHNAQRLCAFINKLDAPRVHIVAHSLGGIVTLQALHDQPGLIDGRIVLLGSPVNGSVIARRLYRYRLLRWMIGHSAENALLQGGARWAGGQSLGTIAGTRPVGVGWLLGGFEGPNDGTVALAETVLENVDATISFYSSHFGLVASRAVAAAVSRFLRQGRFGS